MKKNATKKYIIIAAISGLFILGFISYTVFSLVKTSSALKVLKNKLQDASDGMDTMIKKFKEKGDSYETKIEKLSQGLEKITHENNQTKNCKQKDQQNPLKLEEKISSEKAEPTATHTEQKETQPKKQADTEPTEKPLTLEDSPA